jgi:hypothetical protein
MAGTKENWLDLEAMASFTFLQILNKNLNNSSQ